MKRISVWSSLCDKWHLDFDQIKNVEWPNDIIDHVEYIHRVEFLNDWDKCERQEKATIEKLIGMAHNCNGEIVKIDNENLIVETTDFLISYGDDWHIKTQPISEEAKERVSNINWNEVNSFVNEYSDEKPSKFIEPEYKGDEYPE